MSERFKEHAWKACVGETRPWVQIPPSPPYLYKAQTARISIKTAIENYSQDRRFGRPRAIAAYENAFDQLLENLPRGVRFID